ncbi:ABC transporter substrate-binding protein [Desulfitobacterium metallireducens]|uniref:Ethanolamine utilization protein EutJ n=1 Tax=Desulfitobacterium metallireducens DSM 15288 TaxID=871968 RepID=W0EFQ2_9FIRM|nr:ABC transporter substrate-binding protein [Desulfitobacterium metallireducens]AHF08338.1 ethanolamine utilization protein EutJ [Desulfitobacterium metallireducens DSM 15288]
MKKIFTMATVAVLSLSLLAGCGTSGGATGSGAGNGGEIKIGGLFEQTGGAAQYGTAGLNGAQLAIDQQNAKGGVLGKQIKLVTADNKSEPGESTAQATRLVTSEKVVGMLGPMTTKTLKAIIPIVTQNKVPLVTPSGTASDLTVANGKLNQWIFRACFIDDFQGNVGATFATEKLQAKKAAIIIDTNGDYAKGLAKAFEDTFTKAGGQIVAKENYVAGDKAFQPILGRIKAQNPDLIYVPGYYNEVGLIVKQARELGITVPMLGGDGWNGDETTKIAGANNMTNVYYSDHVAMDDPGLVEFAKQYQTKYNIAPTGFSALGYDAATMLIKGIEAAGSTDPDKVRTALESIKDLKGVSGNITVDPATHNPNKSAVMLQFKDGKWAFASRIDSK